MTKAYQYYASGYYAGEVESYGLLPNNATYDAPTIRKGYVPRWTGSAWEQIEDYRGREGWLDGEPHTINTPGPLPKGWSETLPEPSKADLLALRKTEILSRLQEIDMQSIRPLRAVASGDAIEDDTAKLEALADEAEKLRAELAALSFGEGV